MRFEDYDDILEERIPARNSLFTEKEALCFYKNNCFIDNKFMFHFREYFPVPNPKKILDIGCGTGWMALHTALSFPDAQVVGVDGSKYSIYYSKMFKSQVEKHNNMYISNLDFAHKVLPSNDWNEQFDLIISRSTLHQFSSAADFWTSVKLHLADGGSFHIRDLRRPSNLEEIVPFIRNASDFMKDMYAEAFFASYRTAEVKKQISEFLRAEVKENRNHISVSCKNYFPARA